MRKTNKETEYWPRLITQKDFNLMIKLYLQKKIEKQYAQEIQSFYKIPSFGLAIKSTSTLSPGEYDQRLLKNVFKKAQEKAFLLNNMIMAIGLLSWQIFSISSGTYS